MLRTLSRSLTSDYTSAGLVNAQSIGNKCAAICDRIASDRLDLCAVVETWHDSADSTQLIACALLGYRFVEKARPRTDAAMQTMRTNHGGICLFHRSTISVREVPLPKCKSALEALAVYLHAARCTALVVILYRPGSDSVSNVFFDDLDDILEHISTYACPMIMMGDLNLHLDVTLNPSAVRFQTAIENYGLLQHISSPTHRAGHILDVFITRTDIPVHDVDVQPPEMSDHSFITLSVDLQLQHDQPTNSIRRRQWRDFNYDQFCTDLSSSSLLCDPPRDAVGLFTCYHDTLQALVDKHAPFAVYKLRAHPTAPWYDLNCHLMKIKARRLERIYRHDKSDRNRQSWRRQSRILRSILHEKYVGY